MHTKVLRGLRIRHAPLLDQPHSLKLELACKLPPLHDTPPVPSKHLTRCLRNRVQAIAKSLEVADCTNETNFRQSIYEFCLASARGIQFAQVAQSTFKYYAGRDAAVKIIQS